MPTAIARSRGKQANALLPKSSTPRPKVWAGSFTQPFWFCYGLRFMFRFLVREGMATNCGLLNNLKVPSRQAPTIKNPRPQAPMIKGPRPKTPKEIVRTSTVIFGGFLREGLTSSAGPLKAVPAIACMYIRGLTNLPSSGFNFEFYASLLQSRLCGNVVLIGVFPKVSGAFFGRAYNKHYYAWGLLGPTICGNPHVHGC